jgi:hypothetical protein
MANMDEPLINIVTENKPKVPDCHGIVVSRCANITLREGGQTSAWSLGTGKLGKPSGEGEQTCRAISL